MTVQHRLAETSLSQRRGQLLRYLWLLWLPLLFLPELNLAQNTSTTFGVLTVSDFLIGPYILLVGWAVRQNRSRPSLLVDRLSNLSLIFVLWAFFSTLLIPIRFAHSSNQQLLFSLLKLGKLGLYGWAGFLTARALANEAFKRWFDWSLLFSMCILGSSLFASETDVATEYASRLISGQPYRVNSTSALLAILICYIVGRLLSRENSITWRLLALPGLALTALGFLLNSGRGGWIAAILGCLYLLYRFGFRKSLLIALIGIGAAVYAYQEYPHFRYDVDRTLWPDERYLQAYGAGIGGLDDGGRLKYWSREGKKLWEAPLLGRGLFNRGTASGLDPDGSHNFFIQMFLETGIVGGLLVLVIFARMWKQTSYPSARSNSTAIAFRAVLIASLIVGMSGEYFYGGMVLFTLLALYGTLGSTVSEHTSRAPYRRENTVASNSAAHP